MSLPKSGAVPELAQPGLFRPLGFERLPPALRLAIAVAVLGVFAGIGYFAATHYPKRTPTQGSELERQIAAVFTDPAIKQFDDSIVGDLLIERFHILDVSTGERFVADFLKGQITSVQPTFREDSLPSYMLLLDVRNMRRDRAALSAFVNEVARPPADEGYYLGLVTPLGATDAFPLNYSGLMPAKREPFRGPDDEDIQTFLLRQKFDDVTSSARLIPVEGFNFLLSNSERFPVFQNEFGISKAVFVSELQIVDTTAKPQKTALVRIFAQYPHSLR